MKKNVMEFVRRGVAACGFGPFVLAVLYLILRRQGVVTVLTVEQVSRGIFSLTALAFIAGGLNMVYQIERLPLMAAILLHGVVLYVSYLATYLVNGWLEWGSVPLLVFTGIFVGGYLAIWLIIYLVMRARTARLNEILKEKNSAAGER